MSNLLAPAVATKEATDASSVVTQETTLEDSLRNDMATLLQPLSPSVSPSGNGCRGDSNWLSRQSVKATAVAIRKARGLANGWREPCIWLASALAWAGILAALAWIWAVAVARLAGLTDSDSGIVGWLSRYLTAVSIRNFLRRNGWSRERMNQQRRQPRPHRRIIRRMR